MKKPALLIAAVALLAGGCSKKAEEENAKLQVRVAELEERVRKHTPPATIDISGEVFIATKGGPAIKLPAVEVALVAENDLGAWLASRRDERAKLLAALKPKLEAAADALTQSEEQAMRADETWTAAMEAFAKNTSDAKLYEAGNVALAAYEAARAAQKQKQFEKTVLDEKASTLSTSEFLFRERPKATLTTQTNSEGKFRFTVPKDGKWLLVAAAERLINEKETEHYYWIVDVEPPSGTSGEVLLSSRNLLPEQFNLFTK
jgi:hypothetical protein